MCIQNEIECQVDMCSCWRASHDVKRAARYNALDAASMKMWCRNVSGMYVVDVEGIAQYREKYVVAARRETETDVAVVVDAIVGVLVAETS